MQFNTYTAAGAHIAVWLVNHPAPEAAALGAELHRHDVHDALATAAEAAALRPWAARLRAVFEAAAVADKARLTDALLVQPTAGRGWSATTAARRSTSTTRRSRPASRRESGR